MSEQPTDHARDGRRPRCSVSTGRRALAERNAEIARLHADAGLTYGQLAARYGVSRQRVHYICRRAALGQQ